MQQLLQQAVSGVVALERELHPKFFACVIPMLLLPRLHRRPALFAMPMQPVVIRAGAKQRLVSMATVNGIAIFGFFCLGGPLFHMVPCGTCGISPKHVLIASMCLHRLVAPA